TALRDEFRVYSFAAAGAPLSEFPVYAERAVKEFGAAAAVIAITNHDYTLADIAYNAPAGFWVYRRSGDGELHTELVPYAPGRLREIARYSALVRYLMLNLRIGERLVVERGAPAPPSPAMAGAPPGAGDPRDKAASAVLAVFFRDLP